MGKRISHIDGLQKSTGRAKYTSDTNKPGMLFRRDAHFSARSCQSGQYRRQRGEEPAWRDWPFRVISGPGTGSAVGRNRDCRSRATSEEVANDALRQNQSGVRGDASLVVKKDLSKGWSARRSRW
jgi:hypothetical protein